MGYPETFEGFMVDSSESWSTFRRGVFIPKTLDEHDVDLKIHACGVCASDVHTVTGGWGKTSFPLVPGHEIIGEVVAVGDKVTTLKKGDRAGVGAQIWSCLKCELCCNKNENYCPHLVDTYNDSYPDGTSTQGGFASHIRAHEYFAFKIPDAIPTAQAAPMLCAGLTTFSPLKRNNIGPGSKVGVIGLGGLGHFGVLWAAALGAEVYVLSRSSQKRQDALALGATDLIDTTIVNWNGPYKFQFDMLLCTANSTEGFDIDSYLSTLKVHGKFWNVGLPENPLPQLTGFSFVANGAFIGGSHLGSREDCLEMLQLAAEKGIKSWVEEIQISEEGCKQVLERLKKRDVKYRFTLVGYAKAFE